MMMLRSFTEGGARRVWSVQLMQPDIGIVGAQALLRVMAESSMQA